MQIGVEASREDCIVVGGFMLESREDTEKFLRAVAQQMELLWPRPQMNLTELCEQFWRPYETKEQPNG